MSKDKAKSKSQLRQRNHSKQNAINERKNIFQLINSIPKKIDRVDIKEKDPIIFAENLISFLKEIHPEELQKLKFNPKEDNANTLISSLVDTIGSLDYQIVFYDEDKKDNQINILYDIDYGEWMWYLFDTAPLYKIETEELRIGYAYFLNHYSEICYHDGIGSDYINEENTAYKMEFEMAYEHEQCYDDEGEIDEGLEQSLLEDQKADLTILRTMKEHYNSYIQKPYDQFLNYEPKNDFEKGLKECLIKGIEMDFSIVNKFMPDQNIHDEGGIEFDESFIIYLDIDKSPIEEQHFKSMNEQANNAVSSPNGWFSIDNGIVQQKTSFEDIEYLKSIIKYLNDIYIDFLNKL